MLWNFIIVWFLFVSRCLAHSRPEPEHYGRWKCDPGVPVLTKWVQHQPCKIWKLLSGEQFAPHAVWSAPQALLSRKSAALRCDLNLFCDHAQISNHLSTLKGMKMPFAFSCPNMFFFCFNMEKQHSIRLYFINTERNNFMKCNVLYMMIKYDLIQRVAPTLASRSQYCILQHYKDKQRRGAIFYCTQNVAVMFLIFVEVNWYTHVLVFNLSVYMFLNILCSYIYWLKGSKIATINANNIMSVAFCVHVNKASGAF